MSKKTIFLSLILVAAIAALSYLPVDAQDTDDLQPFEMGPHFVGFRSFELEDIGPMASQFEIAMWYPAMVPYELDGVFRNQVVRRGWVSAAPSDSIAAPYPLLIYSHGWTLNMMDADDAMVFLASHGYVVVAIGHVDSNYATATVERMFEVSGTIDWLEAIDDDDLTGMIDTTRVGIIGFSQGSIVALQTLGLYTDVAHYNSICAEGTIVDCLFTTIGQIDRHRTSLGLDDSSDGGWEPYRDERIAAVVLNAPCNFPLIEPESFASVSTPVLITYGTSDACDYQNNAVRAYDNLITADRFLVTLVGRGHDTFRDQNDVRIQMALPFFSRYLREDEKYSDYLSAEFAETFTAAVWGPYTEDGD